MTVAIFWLLFAVAVGIFASNRGRSGIGWFFLSVLISPLLGLIFCAVFKNLNEPSLAATPSEKTHRKCPLCAEFVLPEATICKHCRSPLPGDANYHVRQVAAQKESEARETTSLITGIVFVVVLFAAAGMISKCSG